MRKMLTELLVALILGIVPTQNSAAETSGDTIAITDVTIIDVVDGTISNNMTLIIEGNIISEIGATIAVEILKHAKIVRATGKYVIPGLWDMHAHTSSEANTRGIIYPLFIANGITGIRVMSADCFEPCWELTLNIEQSKKIQEDVREGKLIGPRAILASTYIRGAKPGDSSTVKAPGTKEHGKELVHLLMDRGVDFIKIYDELPREAYFGIAEEANKQGIPFAGHTPVAEKA